MNREVNITLPETLASKVDLLIQLNQTNWNDLIAMLLEEYTTKSIQKYLQGEVKLPVAETKKITITHEMTACAYSIAKKVYEGELTRSEGKLKIHQQSGMNAGSGQDYITNFLAMMKGDSYVRTMSTEGTEYFLRQIHHDYGKNAFLLAVEATEKHIEYYKDISGAPSRKRVQVLAKLKIEFT